MLEIERARAGLAAAHRSVTACVHSSARHKHTEHNTRKECYCSMVFHERSLVSYSYSRSCVLLWLPPLLVHPLYVCACACACERERKLHPVTLLCRVTLAALCGRRWCECVEQAAFLWHVAAGHLASVRCLLKKGAAFSPSLSLPLSLSLTPLPFL